jgi:hypothetical protein
MPHSVINEQMATRMPAAWRGTTGIKPAAQALLPHWMPGHGRVAWSGKFIFNCFQWSSLGTLARMQVVAGMRRFLPASVSDASVVRHLDLLCSQRGTGAVVVTIGPVLPYVRVIQPWFYPAGCACQGNSSAPGADSSDYQSGVFKYAGYSENFTSLGNKETNMPSFISRDGLRSAGAATQTAYKNGTVSRLHPAGQTGATSGASTGGWTSPDTSSPTTPGASSTTSQLLGLAGSLIGTTGSTIATYLNNDNQQAIATINAATQRYIADLQAQMASTTSETQRSVLAAQAQQAQALQALLAQRGTQSNTPLYIGLAAAGVVGLGLVAYIATRKGARHNPVVGRRGRRHFVSAAKARRMRHR